MGHTYFENALKYSMADVHLLQTELIFFLLFPSYLSYAEFMW
jgi:hypothetical protein